MNPKLSKTGLPELEQKMFVFVGNPNEAFKRTILECIKSKNVRTIPDLLKISKLTLAEICEVSEVCEEQIIEIFLFKQGIWWLEASSPDALPYAIGEVKPAA